MRWIKRFLFYVITGVGALGILLSFWLMNHASALNKEAERKEQRAETVNRRFNDDRRTLSTLEDLFEGKPSKPVRELGERLPVLIQQMKSSVGRYGVSLTDLTIGDSNKEAAEVISFVHDSPFPALGYIPLQASGEWRSLASFVDWLDAIENAGGAITKLAIDGQQYDLTVRMYGTRAG